MSVFVLKYAELENQATALNNLSRLSGNLVQMLTVLGGFDLTYVVHIWKKHSCNWGLIHILKWIQCIT